MCVSGVNTILSAVMSAALWRSPSKAECENDNPCLSKHATLLLVSPPFPPLASGDSVKARGETRVNLSSVLSSSLQLVFNATLLLEPFV